MSFTEGAPAVGSVAHLLPQTYKRLISEWLEEDTPSFDYGGFVVGEEPAEARLLGKSKVRAPCMFQVFNFVFYAGSSYDCFCFCRLLQLNTEQHRPVSTMNGP